MNTRLRPFSFSHPLKEQLEHLLSVEHDLIRSKDALQLLIGTPPLFRESGVIASALYTQALVSYVRCFASGRRKGLNRDIYVERPDLLARHEDMKSVRDRHIAHPVGEHERWDILVASKDETSPAIGFGIHSWFFVGAAPKELKEFLGLVKYAHAHVERSITSLGNQLAKEVIGGKATWKSAQRMFYKHITAEDVYGPTHPEA